MSQTSRIEFSKADELPLDIEALLKAVEELPEQYREKLQPLVSRVTDSTRRRRRILNLVQDALSQLRLDLKYLMFDLDATRGERDDYRRMLEDASQ